MEKGETAIGGVALFHFPEGLSMNSASSEGPSLVASEGPSLGKVGSLSPVSEGPSLVAELRQKAGAYGLDIVDSLDGLSFSKDVVSGISESWASKNEALPATLSGANVLLTVRPDCLETLQQAQLLTGLSLRPVLLSPELLTDAIASAFQGESVPDFRGSVPRSPITQPQGSVPRAEEILRGSVPRGDASVDLLAGSESAPAVQTLNALLVDAVRKQASDVHFEPWTGGLRVRFRIDGGLYEQPAPPPPLADAIVSRLKVMARMDIAERRLPQDGMAQVRLGDRIVDLRVSTIPVADGERVVLRLLDRDNAWLPLADLGMGPSVLAPFSELLIRPHGLVVVSGPTGSGKTTTLYSALATLDSSRRNILTVEDPVEYRLPAIGQIQVKPKIGLTFAAGLRHILRQDPDVILVGETRDAETAEIAVRAALTGHLVFTTLHTNDAPSAVARLVDMGVEPYLLASCLRGVLAQRLVRRLCSSCRRSVSLAEIRSRYAGQGSAEALLGSLAPGATLHEAVGCSSCLEGYRGRLGLFEYMGVNAPVAEGIRLGSIDASALRHLAEKEGAFQSLAQDAVRKILQGDTDFREALAAVM